MQPSSTAPAGFCEINAFHLRPGEGPPDLVPQGHYTYGHHETLQQIMLDVRQNLCVPARVHSWAMWLEDLPAEDHSGDGDRAADEEASPLVPTAEGTEGGHVMESEEADGLL